MDNGNLDFLLEGEIASGNISFSGALFSLFSTTFGGIGLHDRWFTFTCGCGRTMASFGALLAVLVVLQLGLGAGGRLLVFGDSMAIAANVSEETDGANNPVGGN